MSQGTATFDHQPPRILIVEDEPILALTLEELLVEDGFAIAGLASSLDKALAIIESGACDAAILDTNLAGVNVGPAAVALTARGVPFLILSGNLPNQQNSALAGAPYLQKPCRNDRIMQVLRSILEITECDAKK